MFSVILVLTVPFMGVGRGIGSVQVLGKGFLQVHLHRQDPPCLGDPY